MIKVGRCYRGVVLQSSRHRTGGDEKDVGIIPGASGDTSDS